MNKNESHLRELLEARSAASGFDVFAVALPERIARADYFEAWLASGKHASMAWLARNPELRTDPRLLLEGCQSVVMLGTNCYQERPARRGVIARYALGLDYHDVIMPKLKALCAWLAETHGGNHRPFVDASAVMEKPHAAKTLLGWQGKNTMLIHPQFGNWLMLGGILTTLRITPDHAPAPDRCGSCTRCIQACPTGAITAPYQLNARRCISYLTIEHHGSIPVEFRKAIGEHLFGCDDCLDVCPWNRWAITTREAAFSARPLPELRDMLSWTEATFRATFRGTPIFRLKWERWLRNICVVLGNIGSSEDLPALEFARDHTTPLIAEHATWAITQISGNRETIYAETTFAVSARKSGG